MEKSKSSILEYMINLSCNQLLFERISNIFACGLTHQEREIATSQKYVKPKEKDTLLSEKIYVIYWTDVDYQEYNNIEEYYKLN